MEREETDLELLEQLYRIDHIAVRLQRNADSLMLLAGIRESGIESQPIPLANVIRASLAQIEGYERVSLRSETEVAVEPDIVGDLTLMFAELLENAVAFSPSHTPVEVVVRPGADVTEDGGALIEIIDHGLGMNAERLAEENARLVRRERLDLAPTEVLGLFVVGSLARRWDVRVTLTRTPGGGVSATVWVPAALLSAMSTVDLPEPVTAGPVANVTPLPARPGKGATGPVPSPQPAAASAVPPQRPGAPSPRGELPRRGAPPADAGPTTAERTVARTDAERTVAADKPPSPRTSRPLRRRERGATLARAASPVDRTSSPVPQLLDAEAVRSELDAFEAAVLQAEQDYDHAPTGPEPSQHQKSQKEPGSAHVDS
jgi:anti-sigma regulatory factor (Ser/Thr protein kinase)